MALLTKEPVIPKEFETVITLEEEFNLLIQKFLDQKRKECSTIINHYHRGRNNSRPVTTKSIYTDLTQILDPRKLETAIKAIVAKIITIATESVEKDLDVNITQNPSFKQVVGERAFSEVKGLTDDLAEKLRNEVMLGWNMGEGITEIKARIEKVWDNGNLTDARAEMIARTETQQVYNGGRWQAARDSGVTCFKRWNAVGSPPNFTRRTSEDSRELDGQTRPLEQPFYDEVNHQFVDFPPNRPNCRCRVDIVPI